MIPSTVLKGLGCKFSSTFFPSTITMTNTSETKTCADPSLTLGDLITVINEIRLDNGKSLYVHW